MILRGDDELDDGFARQFPPSPCDFRRALCTACNIAYSEKLYQAGSEQQDPATATDRSPQTKQKGVCNEMCQKKLHEPEKRILLAEKSDFDKHQMEIVGLV